MQRASLGYLILGIALLSGCTRGIPEISALQSSIELPPTEVPIGDQPTISEPTFGGLPTGSATVVSIIQPLILAGECSPQFTGLEVSKDNGTTWLIAPTAGGDLDCSDGLFTIAIANPSSFFGIPTNSPATQSVLVRGLTQSGSSGSGEFVLNYEPPKISVGNGSVLENSGTVDLTVTLDKASVESISVLYTSNNGTAVSGSDFPTTSGTLIFAPGETSKTVTVNISPDALFESDETFYLDLSSSTNASIFVPQATVTIENDDVMPTISLALSSYSVSESSGNAIVTVTLNAVSGVDTQFTWNTSDNGATAGNDYTASSGPTVIPAGSLSVGISVPVINDTNLESSTNEKFTIDLTGATNATLSEVIQTTVNITSDDVPVVVASHPIAPNWNDYVRQINTTSLCDGTEIGDYFTCIHGGERKKIIVHGHTNCTNLTLIENLNIFDWTCDNTSGTATFYSKGLRPGKGLRDLLDNGTGAWRNNSISIRLSGDPIGVSTSLPWWSNPTVDLATMDNSDGVTIKYLNTPGTVYFIASDRTTFGYQIGANKISVVSLASSKFIYKSNSDIPNCSIMSGAYISTGVANPRAIFCGGTKKFIWLEVNADGFAGGAHGANTGVLAYNWLYSRIHNSKFLNGENASTETHYGLNLINSSKNLITGLDIYRYPAGVQVSSSSINIFRNLNIASTTMSSDHYSMKITSLSGSNSFYDTRISNHSPTFISTDAVRISGDNNIFSRLNISNANVSSFGSGLHIDGSASNNTFTQVVSTGIPNTGILINGADNNIISFFTAANNNWNGIYLDNLSNNNNFVNSTAIINMGGKAIESNTSGTYATTLGNHFYNIATSATVGAVSIQDTLSTLNGYILTNSACGNYGGPISPTCAGGSQQVYSISTTSDFVRKATSDSTNGAVDRSFSLLNTDVTQHLWSAFDSFFRNWGKFTSGGVTFSNSIYHGNCTTGENCSIWDWRVANGSPLHNTSIAGSASNPAFTPGTCISGIRGDPPDVVPGPGGNTFLKNAIEIDGDRSTIDGPFIGNENGLCESGEHCIYAPNIGAYQGEGALSTSFCTTDGTEVYGAKIFTYSTTGI